MKKIVLSLSCLLVTAFFISCGSTKISLQEQSPIVILGVEGNPTVLEVDANYDTDPDSGGAISNAVNKLLDGSNPEILKAQDRIDFAEDSLRIALSDIAGMEVIDREILQSSKIYKQTSGNVLNFVNTNLVPDGYKKGILSLGAKRARLLMNEVGAKSIISAEFEFDKRKVLKSSSTVVYAVVKMKIRFFDERGKQIISKDFVEESSKYVETFSGSYDRDEFVELYPEVTENIINKFIVEYL